jgi:hypothetical protein
MSDVLLDRNGGRSRHSDFLPLLNGPWIGGVLGELYAARVARKFKCHWTTSAGLGSYVTMG